MPRAITYRPMQASDLTVACQLWSEAEGVELAEGDSVAELTQYLLRNPGMSYVAATDAGIIGAILAGHDGRRGLLYHLAVAQNSRGFGIGRELVARAVEALKQANLSRVLILVARDNEIGRAFWIKQGWEAMEFAEPMGLDL